MSKPYREPEFLMLGQKLGMNQSEVAEVAGCSEKTICNWEIRNNISRGSSDVGALDMLRDLRRVSNALGHTPSKNDYTNQGKYSTATLQTHFDSWAAACLKAGLPPNANYESVGGETVLIRDLRSIANKVGHTPSQVEYIEYGNHALMSLVEAFGSWSSAQEAAGLEPNECDWQGADDRLYDAEWLEDAYSDMSTYGVAQKLGCAHTTVLNALKRYDIETRSRSTHSVYCEVLDETVDSQPERSFARGLKDAGLLDESEYHPDPVNGWEPDFRVHDWLVECKNGDIAADMGGEPARQAPAMGACDEPVLVYGLESDGESLPHDMFIEYVPGEVPDLEALS